MTSKKRSKIIPIKAIPQKLRALNSIQKLSRSMLMTNRASRMFSISKNSDQTNSKAQLWLTLKLNQEVFSYLRLKQWNLSIILVFQLTIPRRMVANQQHSISQMVVGNALSVKITTSRVEKSATDARKSDPDRI